MPRAMLVFDRHEIPAELLDDLSEVMAGLHSGGNGFHVPWTVQPDDEDQNTAGYVTVGFGKQIDRFFLDRGCQKGQEILILNEW